MSSVNLVAISTPLVPELGRDGTAEDFIAFAARVSNPSNQANSDTSDRLIRYLIKNRHWSPFEMVSMTLEINTTRDIGRQILRHRSFSFQEFSQRYAQATGFRIRETRLQDAKNRQNSIETDDDELKQSWVERQEALLEKIKDNYHWALENGIAKEQARVILPEGLTESRLYMAGTLRSWIHYCDLRMKNGTQKEHMEIADLCFAIMEEQFPNIAAALKDD